jgi:hypothetical protein
MCHILTQFFISSTITNITPEELLYDLTFVSNKFSIVASPLTEEEIEQHLDGKIDRSEISGALDAACETPAGYGVQHGLPEEELVTDPKMPDGAYNFQLRRYNPPQKSRLPEQELLPR